MRQTAAAQRILAETAAACFYKATWLVLLAAVAAGPYSASELYNIVYIAVDVWFDAVWLLAVLEIHATLTTYYACVSNDSFGKWSLVTVD